ncbi:MAG TPA: DUF433 domain-containing protein [Gemmataceae bacterium]|nr:DUF433 domain-containing protein [Gemmataceae bacterium]
MASTLILEPRAVPLTRLENGVYRVTGTRIPLERVVESYKDGATPEEIVDSFDTLRLSDVYTLIGYYLDHREEVEQYLREQEEDAEEIRRMIEAAQPPRPGFKEELLRRKALLEKGNASTGHGR